jgi:hypothetical protein
MNAADLTRERPSARRLAAAIENNDDRKDLA